MKAKINYILDIALIEELKEDTNEILRYSKRA